MKNSMFYDPEAKSWRIDDYRLNLATNWAIYSDDELAEFYDLLYMARDQQPSEATSLAVELYGSLRKLKKVRQFVN